MNEGLAVPLLENQPVYQLQPNAKTKGIIPEHREERRQVRTRQGSSHMRRVGKASQRQPLLHEVAARALQSCVAGAE